MSEDGKTKDEDLPRKAKALDYSNDDHLRYYHHWFSCKNCRHRNDIYILKGVPAKDVALKCENCEIPQ